MTNNAKKMVTGFNHNIKHRGQIFHVQTEDSGVDNPHIITHLFIGGNILASKKTPYGDIVHAENLPEVVRALMEDQHKEMLRNLINGVYDAVLEQYANKSWQPGVLDGSGAPAAPAAPTAPSTAPASQPAAPAAPAMAPPAAPAELPPEVIAAQNLAVKPKPKEGGDTIFGEDLISERSLDEVILSYLAEDTGES